MPILELLHTSKIRFSAALFAIGCIKRSKQNKQILTAQAAPNTGQALWHIPIIIVQGADGLTISLQQFRPHVNYRKTIICASDVHNGASGSTAPLELLKSEDRVPLS